VSAITFGMELILEIVPATESGITFWQHNKACELWMRQHDLFGLKTITLRLLFVQLIGMNMHLFGLIED
jgi:hypothetical protein